MARTAARQSAGRPAGRRPHAQYLRLAETSECPFPGIDGTSPPIETLKRHMCRVAQDPFVTVLIQGESGTGKERVASAIHDASPRRHAPFIVVNCAALPPTLVEDELFGHVRGAFTGAAVDRRGPFERASGGTVFLDEVGELPLEAQTRLLRILQERTVQRLGSDHEAMFDVRVIAATNVDLNSAVAGGRFRHDLFYRLKVYELRVPPLRERGLADLRVLASVLLNELSERRRRPVATLDEGVFDLFSRYEWPGNVRELENMLERMLVAAEGDTILVPAHLPDHFPVTGRASTLSARDFEPPLPPSLENVRAALERQGHRHGRAAAELGLSRHQLYRLLKRLS